jgi:hypothetical protein
MLFSDVYSVKKGPKDDWFDPILDHDTKVFIDPFLIFRKGSGLFAESHDQIMGFFNRVFEIATRTGGKTSGVSFGKLLDVLLFPEVDELRLGYAGEGHGGAGTARGFAKAFAFAIMESIALGLIEYRHFEEIGIFNKHIGRDRISDIAANILKPQLISYTQSICARHKRPCQSFQLRLGFDLSTDMWVDDIVELPVNPSTGDAVLLVPKAFLRTEPSLAKDGFRDYLWEKRNEELRNDFNYAIKGEINYEAIADIARDHPDWVFEYVKHLEAEGHPTAYDLGRDPQGLYRWHQVSRDFVEANPYKIKVETQAEFGEFIKSLSSIFKFFVEQKNGWKLIWDNKNSPLSEEGIQNYFYGITYHYCTANNIVMLREVETGRGPVDFHFSSGFKRRAMIEAKLAKNGKFWNNLKNQLPEYMLAEEIAVGAYLVVCYRDDDMKKKVPKIRAALKVASGKVGYPIGATIVDARPGKPSASKIK